MAQNNINQNGNFHTPLSPMRFQSSMGKEVRRKYKDGKNMVRLSLARVTKVNYKYNTVDVVTIKDKNSTAKNPNDNGKFSARLPVQFGGQTPDGKVYGTNTLVTVGSLVLIGYLEGHKDNPIVINIYGGTDNQSMLTRTTFTGADESDEALQQELWQLFTLYPSMTYKNIDGHGNQEVTFPGKTFFYASADDSRVNDAFFDYDHLPSSHYANGDLIEPTSPDAPNMLYVHQSVIDNHRVTFFIKSDGTVRMGSRHPDGKGVTFWQLGTDGSFRIQQSNDTVDPEDQSSNFSSFSIEPDGVILLKSGENVLEISNSGLLFNGGAINGSNLDLSQNQTIKDMQGNITTLQQATTSDGIVNTVTQSTPWHNINNQVTSKSETFVSQPVPPYNIGDIWKNGSSVYVCTNPKGSGATFAQLDWTLSADVTSQNTAADTSNVNGTPSSTLTSNINNAQSTANNAQSTAQAKTEMFLSQPNPPYNKGDIWNDNGVIYVSNISRPSTAVFEQADWVKSADITANNTANDTSNVNGTPSSTVTSNISNAQSTASNAQTAANNAQSSANTAQTTANSKAKTFTSTPTVPYSLGDMWNQNGKVYSCVTAESSTGAFNAADWVLVADMTSQNTANDTANVNGTASSTVNSNISNAQSTANNAQSLATSKAKGFISQPVPPYSQGDVWDNSGTVYICTTARSTGSFTQSDWTLSGDVTANNTAKDTSAVNGTSSSTVISNISNAQTSANNAQTTANSKAQGFVAQPVPPYNKGDVWNNSGTVYICTTAKASGTTFAQSDWTLSGDVTANNTAKDTSAVNGTASSTVISNISSAQSSANNAQTSANNAQTTANSKAQTFTSTPTVPYSLGDIWKNGQTVYVCTTAKTSSGTYASSDWTLVGDVTSQNTSSDTSNVNGTASSTVISNISNAQTSANNAQTTANSKAQGFVAQPVPPYNKGDVWNNSGIVYLCTTAKASGTTFAQGDWTLAADVTANNTAKDTTNVNGTASTTVISNISNAQTSANNAQTTANSKAKTFTATPTVPYNVGDIWQNGATVYVCTTAQTSSGTYSASNWTLASDVTANNTAKDTSAVNGTASSTVISNISSAQSSANNAQTTANSKAQGFVSQPAPPYSVGDVWNNSGIVYLCTTAKASGTTFAQGDWTLAADVTANNTAKDTSAVNGTSSSTVISNISNAQTSANNAQSTANSKAKTFTTTPTVPYNVGDIWQNSGTVYVCTTAQSSSGTYSASNWTLAGDITSNNTAKDTSAVNGTASSTVISNISNAQTSANNAQTTANSKAQGFVAQPSPPYNKGDVWNNSGTVYICTTAKASGTAFAQADWTLVGDVTANNVAKDTSAVNGTAASTVISNISTAQSTANTAQSTANSKAQTFTATPTVPYNIGDIYKNGSTVYICTTAKTSSGTYSSSDWTLSGDVTGLNTAADTSNVNGVSASTVTSQASNGQDAQNKININNDTSNLAPNPMFDGGSATYWNWGGGPGFSVVASSTTGVPTSAPTAYVGKQNQRDVYGSLYFQVNPGDMYYIEAMVATDGSSTYDFGIGLHYLDSTGSNNSWMRAFAVAKTQTTWAKFSGTITIPTGYVKAQLWTQDSVGGSTTDAGSYYFTNVIVRRVHTANTVYDTQNVNGVAAATVNQNITNAQNTANSKAQTFTSTPVPPYNLGDIYKNGQTVYVCTTAKASGGTYASSDFTLVGDVTSQNTANDTTNVNGTTSSTVISNINNAQSTANTAQSNANSKAKTFTATPTVPYNVGDLWQNGATVYVCTTAKTSSGTYASADWTLASDVTANNTSADTSKVNGTASSTVISNINNAQSSANNAQTTANSKAKTFTGTATPTVPYNVGDIWQNGATVYVCTTAKASGGTYASGDWVLASDVTANNTAKDTSAVNGTASSTVISNINSAQSSANNAQSTANSKAKTWTAQPAPPYSTGDIWQTTNAVYICTAGRSSGSYTASDWYLAGDVTANNTAHDTANVNGTASSTVISNINNAQSTANNAQSAINNLQVGGRNYLKNSNRFDLFNPFAYSGSTASVAVSKAASTYLNNATWTLTTSGTAGDQGVQTTVSGLDNNSTYTISVYVNIPAPGTGVTYTYGNGMVFIVNYANNSGIASVNPTSAQCNGTWQRLSVQAKPTDGGFTIRLDTGNIPSFSMAMVQVELGNRPSDWNQAPEDVQAYTDASSLGGRNYLRNTYQMNDLTNWASVLGSAITATLNVVNDSVYGGVIDLNVTANSTTSGSNGIAITNSGLTLPNGKFVSGNKYTISFLIWNALTMTVNFADSSGANQVVAPSATIPVNTGWVKVVYTFTATATGTTPVFYLSANDTAHTGHVYVTQVMLEDGIQATGYSPAPEDVQNQISTLNSSVNNIQQGVFPTDMGTAIVNQVTSSNDYLSALSKKADTSALSGLASQQYADQAQQNAESYTDSQIKGIDFSPYVQNSKYTQDKADITAQFTQSGGVNMLMNSVGYNGTNFWTVTLDTNGSLGSTVDTTFSQFGTPNAFSFSGGMIQQTVTVTPGVTYTLSAVVSKGTAGTGYMKVDDGNGTANTFSMSSGTAYNYIKESISVTPTSGTLTVTLYGDATSAGLEFGCVMLNVGPNTFTWQQHMGEVYNANIVMDLNGIQVEQTDSNGKIISETLMSPSKFAGYSDLNNDGKIDTTTGSADEIFRMDKDTFRMNSATIGPVKIIQTSGTYNGIAFIKS